MFHATGAIRKGILASTVAASALFTIGPDATPGTAAAVEVTPVTYKVLLSQDATLPGTTYTVRGFHYGGSEPSSTVVLLLHGLSYGYWAGDFPPHLIEPRNRYRHPRAPYLAVHRSDSVPVHGPAT